MNDINKALTLIQGISRGAPMLATRYMDPERFVEHNLLVTGGVDG